LSGFGGYLSGRGSGCLLLYATVRWNSAKQTAHIGLPRCRWIVTIALKLWCTSNDCLQNDGENHGV
jgi:hypothetical protein